MGKTKNMIILLICISIISIALIQLNIQEKNTKKETSPEISPDEIISENMSNDRDNEQSNNGENETKNDNESPEEEKIDNNTAEEGNTENESNIEEEYSDEENNTEVNEINDETNNEAKQDDNDFVNITRIELQIHILVNNERQKNGLNTLEWDSDLTDIARAHSQDMAFNNFFSHTNLDGEGPTERAEKAGYPTCKDLGNGYYQIGIGENIFKGWLYGRITYYGGSAHYIWFTEEEIAYSCFNGWMDSPDHKDNLLSDRYDKEGIGVSISDEDYAVYITQDFW